MRFNTFLKHALSDSELLNHQSTRYIRYHAARFHSTYEACSNLLNAGDHLISVGAGSAIVEKVLAKVNQVKVTVVDFPDAISLNQNYYNHLGFNTIGQNLNNPKEDLPTNSFDVLLSGEIIEHVPKAPYDQLKALSNAIRVGGHVVITTPNMGSFAHILKVILMRPLLQPAEQTFSPVGFENEGVHRREYMPGEIVDTFTRLNYLKPKVDYIYYNRPQNLKSALIYLAGALIPRFRPAMLVVGKKQK